MFCRSRAIAVLKERREPSARRSLNRPRAIANSSAGNPAPGGASFGSEDESMLIGDEKKVRVGPVDGRAF